MGEQSFVRDGGGTFQVRESHTKDAEEPFWPK